ncbi:MAG TPA: hypothetical protein VMI53_14790 [Opitutaceae bacterium]|nr:hypothetical protein [Opitutaceae bacterium]
MTLGFMFSVLAFPLLLFWVPGIVFVISAVRSDKKKFRCLGFILFSILAEYLVIYGGSVFLSNEENDHQSVLFLAGWRFFIAGIFIGIPLLIIHHFIRKNWILMAASSFFISTALYPLMGLVL